MTRYLRTAIALGIAGTLFSGYLAGAKLFTSTCALGETCPHFLGYPACHFGFALFFSILVVALVAAVRNVTKLWPAIAVAAISFAGVLFAAQFVIPEVAYWFRFGYKSYGMLGLSTCGYGLIFFVVTLVISTREISRAKGASAEKR